MTHAMTTQRFSDAVSAEKAFVQQLLDEFAAEHPKIANRLRIGADGSSDPSVGRLVQAFSFMLARTQRRIEDRFPEILNPLVELTDSATTMAIPSLATVEFVIAPDQAPDPDGTVIPRGTQLESARVNDVCCRFQTCSDVSLWPIELTAASLVFPPFGDSDQTVAGATCALRVSLRTLAANTGFDQLNADAFRFFIHSDLREALRIHQALFADSLDVAVRPRGGRPQRLGAGALRCAGLGRSERLLPSASDAGERLLSEFFCFPEKFLYFELQGLRGALQKCGGGPIDIDIYLSSSKEVLPQRIDPRAVLLNCVPAVNLFSRNTSPVEVKSATDRVTLEADQRHPAAYQVHSINRVFVRYEDEVESELPRFHSLQPVSRDTDADLMWELDTLESSAVPSRPGTVGVRFVDPSFRPGKADPCIVHASVTCSNADLPQQLAVRDEAVVLQPESLATVSECRCLAPPTRVRRFALAHTHWDRISELLPDCLTLGGEEGAAALRAAVRLFLCDDDPVLQALIESIVGVELRRASGIVGGQMVCHGVDIQLTFRRSAQLHSGHLLFTLVLREFMSRYATRGTFFRLRAVYENSKEFVQWPMIDGGRFVM